MTDGRATRRLVLWLLGTLVVLILLITYRTSTGGGSRPGIARATSGAQSPGLVQAAPSGSGSPRPSGATTVNGTVVDTQWGPVQVQVSIAGHRITDARALIYPNGNQHDETINAYALPRLRQQVLVAQSARIDGVSGATVTSDGYRESLQAALDVAHLTD